MALKFASDKVVSEKSVYWWKVDFDDWAKSQVTGLVNSTPKMTLSVHYKIYFDGGKLF